MRVALLDSPVPFRRGVADRLRDDLLEALRAEGYDAESLTLPASSPVAGRALDGVLAARLTHLAAAPPPGEQAHLEREGVARGFAPDAPGPPVDRVIALRAPACWVPHPAKRIWLLASPWERDESETGPWGGARVRDALTHVARRLLPEAERLFAPTAALARQYSRQFPLDGDAPVNVLRPPVADPGPPDPDRPRDTLLVLGCPRDEVRITRIREALRLMRWRPEHAWLAEDHTREETETFGKAVSEGRALLPGRIVDAEDPVMIREALARARVALLAGDEEDACGIPLLRARAAGCPVVGIRGEPPSPRPGVPAGGRSEGALLLEGETGRLVPPEASSIAAALDRLGEDEALARALGRQARAVHERESLDWREVLGRLLG